MKQKQKGSIAFIVVAVLAVVVAGYYVLKQNNNQQPGAALVPANGTPTIDGTRSVTNDAASQPVSSGDGGYTIDGNRGIVNYETSQPTSGNDGGPTIDGTRSVTNSPASSQSVSGTGSGGYEINGSQGRINFEAELAACNSGAILTKARLLANKSLPSEIISSLGFGSTNRVEVLKLQAFLNAMGYLDASNVIGIFGSKTKAAVIAFQTEACLPPTGYVGTLTKAKINKLILYSRPVIN